MGVALLVLVLLLALGAFFGTRAYLGADAPAVGVALSLSPGSQEETIPAV